MADKNSVSNFKQDAGNSQGGAFQQGHGNKQTSNVVINNNDSADPYAEAFEKFEALYEAMKENAPVLPDGPTLPPMNPDPLPEPVSVEDFRPVATTAPAFTEHEDHPEVVYSMVQTMQRNPEAATEEEQQSLYERLSSCVAKYATKENAIGALKITAAGVGALSSLAPPFNVIKAVCEAAVALGGP